MTEGDRGRRVLALRFDVDSIRCIEDGIPRLRRLADERGVRFTFFVNMGRSFNWWYTGRHVLERLARSGTEGPGDAKVGDDPAAQPSLGTRSLPATKKLGLWAVARTMILNPMLGDRYRATFDALHADGHELGLHGGIDHVIWQRALDELDDEGLEALFRPAYERFKARYGAPDGFASPGFRYDDRVKQLLDREGFVYASDMGGEMPFHPPRPAAAGVQKPVEPSDETGRETGDDAGPRYDHWEVPVNVMGKGNVPVLEEGLARGLDPDDIVARAVEQIEARDFALMYGHPYVEGVRADLLGRVIEAVQTRYDVVTVAEYLQRWKQARTMS